jgi:hypothetical protein
VYAPPIPHLETCYLTLLRRSVSDEHLRFSLPKFLYVLPKDLFDEMLTGEISLKSLSKLCIMFSDFYGDCFTFVSKYGQDTTVEGFGDHNFVLNAIDRKQNPTQYPNDPIPQASYMGVGKKETIRVHDGDVPGQNRFWIICGNGALIEWNEAEFKQACHTWWIPELLNSPFY